MAKGWKRRADGALYKANHPDTERKATRLITPSTSGGYTCFAGERRLPLPDGSVDWKPDLVGTIAERSTAERWLRGENVGPALEPPPRRRGLMARLQR